MRPLLLALAPALFALACTPQGDPVLSERFCDDFNRTTLGDRWNATSNRWSIEGGQLKVQNAQNHPLWLVSRLPRDVRITFTARSDSPQGDIKIEVFGDGASFAREASYTATSYVVIFGGWNNTLNVLARMNEHGDDRVVGEAKRVVPGQTYRFRIERKGRRIEAYVDESLLVAMDDPSPLEGRGHEHFAFNNWASRLTFDDFCVEPL